MEAKLHTDAMSRGGVIARLMVLVLGIGAAVVIGYAKTQGFSAKAQPSQPERFIARHLLELSYLVSAKTLNNQPDSAHSRSPRGRPQSYTHDCAGCHGDDGQGQTEIGRGLYPKPPNLRHENNIPDDVMFYIIRNGVRFTSMPGWSDPDDELWKEVLYIRDLPNQPLGSQAARAERE